MTKIEMIDYLRELKPRYKESSVLFSYSIPYLEQLIEKEKGKTNYIGKKEKPIQEKTAKEKYYENVTPRKISNEAEEIKRQNKQLLKKVEKLQEENYELKKIIKNLQKQINKIGEIINESI